MPFIELLAQQMGTQAAQGILGAGMGLALEKHNDKRQLRQNEALQKQQIAGSKELTDYNMMKQLEMWNATGYGAQMKQLREAGLNPALIYGMGGAGGQSSNVDTGTVQGGQAPQGGGEIATYTGMGIQSGLMAAQLRNIEAQTEKIKAETQNVPLQGKNIEAHTASLTQGLQNQDAIEKLTRVQTEIAQVAASVNRQTIKEQMQAWENIAEKGTEEIKLLKNQDKLDDAQFADKVQALKTEIATNVIRGALMNAQKHNTEQDTRNKIQEILESEQRIKTMAGQLILAWSRLEYDRVDKRGEEDLKDEGWEQLKGIVPGFLLPIGKGFQGHTPIKGFR